MRMRDREGHVCYESMEDDESSVLLDPLVDFWGVELSSKQKEARWPVEDVEPDVQLRLELRQACLGTKAKAGERNVVEVTTENENGEEVTHTILSLTVGGMEQSPLFLEVFSPVTFNLVAGTGPVHIVGNLHTELDEDFEEDDEESPPELASRKRAANSPPTKPSKTRKLVKENGDSMDTLEEDPDKEEEESEDEEESSDEEESDEEEEEDKLPKKPMAVSKPKAKSGPKAVKPISKTPQPLKGTKTSAKITLSAPNTPEQTKLSKKGVKTTMSMEEMKEKLKKTPNLPKKLDKFGNYVQYNFKVTNDKVKKQLWEYAQKMRAAK